MSSQTWVISFSMHIHGAPVCDGRGWAQGTQRYNSNNKRYKSLPQEARSRERDKHEGDKHPPMKELNQDASKQEGGGLRLQASRLPTDSTPSPPGQAKSMDPEHKGPRP